MATAMIGGRPYQVAFPNFIIIEAAWPFLQRAQKAETTPIAVRGLLGVIAVGNMPGDSPADQLTEASIDEKVERLARELLPTEIRPLQQMFIDLMVEMGIAPPPGEKAPAGEGVTTSKPSPETSTDSSSRSPQDSATPTSTSSGEPGTSAG